MQSRRVQPGDLDQLVDILEEATTADALGGRARTWAVLKQHWAQVVPLIGTAEKDAHGAQRQVMRYRFTTYADRAITAKHRLRWDGRDWNIVEVRLQAGHVLFQDIIAEAGAQS